MRTFAFNIQIGKYTRTFKVQARTVTKAWFELFRIIYPKYIGEVGRIVLL
jgi:hypothetical protein